MSKIQTTSLAVALLASFGCFLSSASACGVLDQSFEPDPSDGFVIGEVKNSPVRELRSAQSFTVEQDGFLCEIEIPVASVAADAGPLIIEIQPTNNDVPDGTVLASVSIERADIEETYNYINIDLSEFDIAVSSGDVLAIVLRADLLPEGAPQIWYAWMGESGVDATYPGGIALGLLASGEWFRVTTVDLGFRTYVAGPTPTFSTSWGEIKSQYR